MTFSLLSLFFLCVANVCAFHALLVAIPAPGHLLPLLGVAQVLVDRGHHVTIASFEELHRHVPRFLLANATHVRWQSLGSDASLNSSGVFAEASHLDSIPAGAYLIENWLQRLYPMMFRALRPLFRRACAPSDTYPDIDSYYTDDAEQDLFAKSESIPAIRTACHRDGINQRADILVSSSDFPLHFDIVVADLVTRAAIDLADIYGVRCVLNNADIVDIMGTDTLPAYDFLPPIWSGLSVNDINIFHRTLLPLARLLLRSLGIVAFLTDRPYHTARHAQGLPPRHVLGLSATHIGKITLIAGVSGVDYARAMPSHLIYVGLTTHSAYQLHQRILAPVSPSGCSHPDMADDFCLPMVYSEWLSASKANNDAVVYVNMGTVAELTDEQLLAKCDTWLELVEAPNSTFGKRVLWKLNARAMSRLRALLTLNNSSTSASSITYSNKLIVESVHEELGILRLRRPEWSTMDMFDRIWLSCWVPPPPAILARLSLIPLSNLLPRHYIDKTTVNAGLSSEKHVPGIFVSHCGVNSVHEALLLGVPVLCVPYFADQLDMAMRLVDQGLGRMIRKTDLRSQLLSTCRAMLEPSNLTESRQRHGAAQNALLLSGGPFRAADIIEHVAIFGVEGLIPVDQRLENLAQWSSYLLIVLSTTPILFVIFLITLSLSLVGVSRLCGRCCAKV